MARTAQIAEPISGDQLYQQRARMALPLLVRQAEAGERIFYSDLAEELDMPNPRNLNYPLGSIGRTLERLSKAWGEEIPPIQCVVVNKNNFLPGHGIGWFLDKKDDFASFSKAKQREIVNYHLARIFAYPRWREVLAALSLSSPKPNLEDVIRRAARFGGGESEEHRKLKEFVANNPWEIGLPTSFPKGNIEVALPSGDCLDVSFETEGEWVTAEVKSNRSPVEDIARGLFQCVKYRAVMEAVQKAEGKPRSARSILVLESKLPIKLVSLRNVLGIEVRESITPK